MYREREEKKEENVIKPEEYSLVYKIIKFLKIIIIFYKIINYFYYFIF